MLNKKRLFALLMVGALLPTCVSAMEGDDGAVGAAAASAAAPKRDANLQQQVPQQQPPQQQPPADQGIVHRINEKFDWLCSYPGTPVAWLQRVANPKVQALVTVVSAYLAWCSKEKVATHVTETLPNAVRSLVGGNADCDGADCRSDWADKE